MCSWKLQTNILPMWPKKILIEYLPKADVTQLDLIINQYKIESKSNAHS